MPDCKMRMLILLFSLIHTLMVRSVLLFLLCQSTILEMFLLLTLDLVLLLYTVLFSDQSSKRVQESSHYRADLSVCVWWQSSDGSLLYLLF